MRAAAMAGVDVPKLCATDRLEAFGSCRLCLVEIDGRRGTPASCTTPCADGMVVRTQTPKVAKLRAERHGALHLRPPAGLPDLFGQRRLRVAGHGRRGRAAPGPVRLRRATNHLDAVDRPQQPVLRLRPVQVHRLLALRAGLRRDPGHVRADHRGPRLRLEGVGRCGRVASWTRSACRAAPACRRARRPPCRRSRSIATRHADPLGDHHLRLLRRRLLVQGGVARRRAGPHGARTRTAAPTRATRVSRDGSPSATPPTRTGMLRPMVREKITDPWREVDVGRGDRHRRPPDAARSRREHGVGRDRRRSPRRGCTNEEVYVVQKMVRAAFGNNNVDTCARVCHSPTGYGLKQTFGDVGRHAGLPVGRRRPTSSW